MPSSMNSVRTICRCCAAHCCNLADAEAGGRAEYAARETARAGVVALPHGWAGTDVCLLTSEIEGIDPGTTQPRMMALPVSITRLIADRVPPAAAARIDHHPA